MFKRIFIILMYYRPVILAKIKPRVLDKQLIMMSIFIIKNREINFSVLSVFPCNLLFLLEMVDLAIDVLILAIGGLKPRIYNSRLARYPRRMNNIIGLHFFSLL